MRLETERLIIRDWTMDDLDALWAVLGDPEVTRYLGSTGQPEESIETLRPKMERMIERGKGNRLGHWAIELKATGEVVGGGVLSKLPDADDIEVSYHLAKRYWGCGYATEATKALLQYGLTDAGLDRIVGITYLANGPSQNVLHKAGMTHKGREVHYGHEMEYFVMERAAVADATAAT